MASCQHESHNTVIRGVFWLRPTKKYNQEKVLNIYIYTLLYLQTPLLHLPNYNSSTSNIRLLRYAFEKIRVWFVVKFRSTSHQNQTRLIGHCLVTCTIHRSVRDNVQANMVLSCVFHVSMLGKDNQSKQSMQVPTVPYAAVSSFRA